MKYSEGIFLNNREMLTDQVAISVFFDQISIIPDNKQLYNKLMFWALCFVCV